MLSAHNHIHTRCETKCLLRWIEISRARNLANRRDDERPLPGRGDGGNAAGGGFPAPGGPLAGIQDLLSRTPASSSVTCPQCKVAFGLVERKPLSLRLFETLDYLSDRLVPHVGAGVLLGSVFFVSLAYGKAAIRLFMGKHASRIALAKPWPCHVSVRCG